MEATEPEAISLADACEWYPRDERAATNRDVVHARAELVVGKNGEWRLCASCAALPRFKQYTRRMPVAAFDAASTVDHRIDEIVGTMVGDRA